MQPKITVKPLGKLTRFADTLMIPFMRWVSGAPDESPQQTHRWNYHKISVWETNELDRCLMARCPGIPGEPPKRGIRFHLPRFGGWRNYIILMPIESKEPWHVGWIAFEANGIEARRGVSRIPLSGMVRMLLGAGEVSFFGVSASTNEQIAIEAIGMGKIGRGDKSADISLL